MNDKKQVKLNYYEVMTLWLKVSELISIDNYYDEELINKFLDYVNVRTMEIDVEFSLLMLPKSLCLKRKLYRINLDVINYLINITRINIFDKEVIDKYSKIIVKDNLYFNDCNKMVKRKIKNNYK